METAVAYIRVSSQRQVDEGGSLDSQTRQIEQYVRGQRYTLARLFREEGESAKTDQRPRLQEMLLYCLDPKNQVRVVIVPKIDRLARNVGDYTNLKIQLTRMGVRLESLGERIEDTPVGRFTETILASVAQFDNEIRAERSKGGMVEAVKQGRWMWKAPFGYRNIRHQGRGTIEPDPDKSRLVIEAFNRVAQFDTDNARLWLKEQGVGLSRSAFYRMIARPVYVGQIHAFGQVYEAAPPFVPLVSEKLFRLAQAGLQRKSRDKNRRDREDFALRGTLRCSCGKLFTAHYANGRADRYAYYRCMSCSRSNHRRETVDRLFARELNTYRLSDGLWSQLESAVSSQLLSLQETSSSSRVRLEQEFEQVKNLRSAIAIKAATGIIPDDIAKEQFARLDRRKLELQTTLDAAPNDSEPARLLEFARSFLEGLGDFWRVAPLTTQKKLLRFMFPNGLEYMPDEGFRTTEYSVLEWLKTLNSKVVSRLVAPELHGSRFDAPMQQPVLESPYPRSNNSKEKMVLQGVSDSELMDWIAKLYEEFSNSGHFNT